MKMKTQIKRKGKRTISLLLTAMLVISTMIVGLATVNAATIKKIYFVNNSNSNWSKVNAYCWTEGAGKNANWPGVAMTKESFHISAYGSADIYSYEVDTDLYNQIIFNDGSSQTGDLSITADNNIFIPSSTTTDGKRNGSWSYYSELSPVAKSVTLTPATQNIVEGKSATLTATLAEKADTDVTLTLTGSDNSKQTATVSGSDTSATFTVSPESDTTYTVTASAEGYDSVVSGNAVVTVTVPKTYYLWTSPKSNLSDSSTWTKNTMSYNDDGTYSFDYTFSTTDDCYVTITESDTNHYSTMVWSGSTDKLTNSSTILKETRVQNYNVGDVRYYYPQLIPAKTGTITITFSDTEKTIVVTDSGATPTEPTTEEPTTEEPSTSPSTVPTTQPTTTPSADIWYLKGSFNSWGTTNPLVGSDNVLTTNVFINSSTVYTLKVWNKNDDKYYGSTVINPAVAAEIKDLQLGYYVGGGETRNVKFQPTQSGVYKFTFNPTTLKLTAELVSTSSLNAEVSAPESVKAGETFSVTAKAILDESSAITPASYKFTIKVGNTTVVNGVTSTTDQYTYNRASISTPSAVSAYVEAYDADGNLLGVSPTVEKTVSVTYEDFSVKLSSDNAEVAKESVVTFTASATPASYASSFDFYVSKNEDFADAEPVSQTLSTYKYTFNEVGTYYVKVVAHNKYAAVTNALDTATSNVLVINVFETLGEHKVNFYFKAPSAFAYKPKMVLDGNTLTVERDANLGASYSGSVTFYWFKATATVDSSVEHQLVITTQRTSASGSIKGHCYDNNYWFAIDNLMNGKELVNLSSSQEYIRNYYHSPLHTVYAGSADDCTLGFTNIDGTRYAMGTYAEGDPSQNATLSIKAATAAQKVVTQLDTYSEVQTCLLDVNLDGKVDVKDATMIQKAIVSLI